MISLEREHYIIVKNILKKYPFEFYAFGSRVKGNHKKFSDLDICCMQDLPTLTKFYLEEEFEESDLPFKVDIIEWNKISDAFKSHIKNDLELL